MATSNSAPVVPNHHAEQPGFSGIGGYVAGLTMIIGRGGVARLAADLTAVTDADRVVDIGCGPGTAAREAARRGAQVTGIDPAPIMLRLARTLTRGSPSISWAQGAAEAVPIPRHSASVLWSISSVHHWRDVDAGLAEAHRVLSAHGRLLAIERHTRPGATGWGSHGWTRAQADVFADRCHDAGFTDVRVESCQLTLHRLLAVRAIRP
jgi:ubiquinone/menaquinone biosynthesis C-methylase UbiE